MISAFPKFQKRLISICANKGLVMQPLGEVGIWPIWLVQSNGRNKKRKNILIAAGFHGEEKAGPLAVLEWLSRMDRAEYKDFNLSFMPVVNPTAFNRYVRYNTWGEKSNCGFCHPETKDKLSSEGQILMTHKDELIAGARDGFLSLHEDVELRKEYYLYTFEPTADPGQFTCGMLEELNNWFAKPLNGVSVTADSCASTPPFVVNGLVYRYCDGSFEDYLFHKGVSRVAVSETPGKAPLQRRIDANIGVINKFITLIREGK